MNGGSELLVLVTLGTNAVVEDEGDGDEGVDVADGLILEEEEDGTCEDSLGLIEQLPRWRGVNDLTC